MLNNLSFALVVTAPIFMIICFGIVLKRMGIITNEFARIGSELVFKVTLPCLLFVKLVDSDFQQLPVKLIVYAVVATLIVFVILDRLIAPKISHEDRGAFVQGSYRANMGIIGLAYCLSAFGEGVLPAASIYLALLTILFNILAVITLSRHKQTDGQKVSITSALKDIATNPLILSIAVALIFSFLKVKVPGIFLDTLGYFAQMTLPLALLCAGASIRWREFHASLTLYWATAAKLVFVPGVILLGGIAVGLRGEQLGVLYLMSSAPTAAASYPMVRSLGGNHFLAAAIIATTSLGSIIAVTLGLFLLRVLGFL